MKNILKRFWPIGFLGLLVLSIAVTNYTPGTWLSGWDNLHPEFNFGLNIKRSVFAVWQEYQGLGLLGGMGHAADLPRQLFLGILSFAISQQFLRYGYHFCMLFAGVIGIYFLSYKFILSKTEGKIRVLGSLLSSVFYLLNLGTVQYFFVPFEPYSTFWGMLPWEIFGLLLYLNAPKKKNLLILSVINVIALPQGYVQTIFLVYIICVLVFIALHLVKERTKQSVQNAVKVVLLIVLINAYWVLPSAYFLRNNFSVNRNASQNILATDKFFFMNKKRGTVQDFIFLKEFYYDFVNYDYTNANFDYMMKEWRNQFSKSSVLVITSGFFILVVFGLFRKNKYGNELTLLFLLSCIFFLSDTSFFNSINILLRQFSINDQLFRNPFTKFIVPTALTFSLLFGISVSYLLNSLDRFVSTSGSKVAFFSIFSLFVYSFLPVWKGNYIYKNMRLTIPAEYFQLFEYLNKSEDKGRIANFPQSNIWGWVYYKWGLIGSGFPWYSVEQPILDRAFDVWSPQNENYYWEITQALYSEDLIKLENVLNKYQVKWIVLDKNIFSYAAYRSLDNEKFQEMLSKLASVHMERRYGDIFLYKFNGKNIISNFIYLTDSLSNIEPSYDWNNSDQAYQEYGDYMTLDQRSKIKDQNRNEKLITNNLQPTTVYYPFRSLFTGRKQDELEFNVTEKGNYFSFQAVLPKELIGATLHVPQLIQEEISQITNITSVEKISKPPLVYLDDKQLVPSATTSADSIVLSQFSAGHLEVLVPKIGGFYSAQANASTLKSIIGDTPRNCDQFNEGKSTLQLVDSDSWLRFSSIGSSNCGDFDLADLSQRLSYLVTVQSRNVEGKSFLFSVINKNSQRADLETYLPNSKLKTQNSKSEMSYFILPPMEDFAIGYTLHFDNISIGREKTVNDLGPITVNPIPYRFLTGLKIVKGNLNQPSTINHQQLISVDHPNPSFYEVHLSENRQPKTDNQTLILSQSFDKGWKAYEITNKWFLDSWYMKLLIPLFHKELPGHVLVNNWENGWNIDLTDQSSNIKNNEVHIVIVYLPQYLEYLGFVLLGGTILYFVFSSRRTFHRSSDVHN
jgi:hypothetical protein